MSSYSLLQSARKHVENSHVFVEEAIQSSDPAFSFIPPSVDAHSLRPIRMTRRAPLVLFQQHLLVSPSVLIFSWLVLNVVVSDH